MTVKALCILAPLILIAATAGAQMQGELDDSYGIPVLRVWGMPYEMGYAHGFLLGDQIREEFDGYIAPLTLHNEVFYSAVFDVFQSLYTMPDRYTEEAQGIIDGAKDAGVDLFIPYLGRELTALDLEVTGAMPDIVGLVSCSTLMAWGEATAGDPELAGTLALVRNMDWLALPTDPSFMARHTIIIARTPNDRRATLSIYFPGLIGCLSCMNDAGVSALQHQVHPGVLFFNRDYSQKFIPINIAMREGLELDDADQDGASTVNDVAAVIEAAPKSSQYNIVLADADPDLTPPLILETANNGSARRYDLDDPDFPPMTLAAVNNFMKLKNPYFTMRYATMRRNANDWWGQISLDRLWENNKQVEMTFPIGDITAQTMIFIPSQRRIAVAFSDEQFYAPEKQPVWFEWDDLFPPSPDDDATDDDAVNDDAVNDDNNDIDDDAADDESGDDDADNNPAACGC